MHILNKIVVVAAIAGFAGCDWNAGEAEQIGGEIGEGIGQVGQEIERGAEQIGQGAQQAGQDIEREVESWDWNAWDANRNASIEADEFNERADRTYGEWAGEDQRLTKAELGAALFESLDRNNNDVLERNEMSDQLVSAVGGEQYGSYPAWDLDNSGAVEQSEFVQLFEQTGVYERWDRNQDQNLEQEEYRQGWFETFDRNRSGTIERDEWGFEGGGV